MIEYYKLGNTQHMRVAIDSSWNVLDAGSGASPFPRADVTMDRMDLNRAQQRGKEVKIDSRLVAGDLQNMPFKDNSFDYIVCTHVLEHVDDPGKACSELIRVGKRGYIETPSMIQEILIGNDVHLWIITKNEEGTLTFRKKTQEESKRFDDLLTKLFYGKTYLGRQFQGKWFKYWQLGYITLTWENAFKCEVII